MTPDWTFCLLLSFLSPPSCPRHCLHLSPLREQADMTEVDAEVDHSPFWQSVTFCFLPQPPLHSPPLYFLSLLFHFSFHSSPLPLPPFSPLFLSPSYQSDFSPPLPSPPSSPPPHPRCHLLFCGTAVGGHAMPDCRQQTLS